MPTFIELEATTLRLRIVATRICLRYCNSRRW